MSFENLTNRCDVQGQRRLVEMPLKMKKKLAKPLTTRRRMRFCSCKHSKERGKKKQNKKKKFNANF